MRLIAGADLLLRKSLCVAVRPLTENSEHRQAHLGPVAVLPKIGKPVWFLFSVSINALVVAREVFSL